MIVLGYWNLSALVVLAVWGLVAVGQVGWPTLTVPAIEVFAHLSAVGVTENMVGATAGQVAMTIRNAAVATSLLVGDYFNREVSPDELATSMGAMNLLAVPLGGIPMCHGSGGMAGKYAFGARTSNANLFLGLTYILLTLATVGLITAYPLSMLGVILVLVALQLAHTSLQHTTHYIFVIDVRLLGVLTNIDLAFIAAISLHLLLDNTFTDR